MRKYKFLEVCGSGIATSTLISSKISENMKARGFDNIETSECSIREVVNGIDGYKPDVIIASVSLETVDTKGIKAFSGVQILYGSKSAAGKVFDEIAEYLKTLE